MPTGSSDHSLGILQISTTDIGGGAERVAWNLFQEYRRREHHSWLAVGSKRTDEPGVLLIAHDAYRSRWANTWLSIGGLLSPLIGRVRGMGRLQGLFHWIGEPSRSLGIWRGYEDFDFPGTWHLLGMAPRFPDIVHGHNFHARGGYFDLRVLTSLSQQVPVVLTVHDAWLLSGHCAHSFDCERWKTGCGHCPDLTIYPAVRRDGTAYNWRRKQEIFAKSRLYVATPSRWLMEKVQESMLVPAIVETRVIPNGVDLSVFHQAQRQAVRVALGISQDARVLLFTANGIKRSIWRDYQAMRGAVALLAGRLHGRVLFIALGEDARAERIGQAEVRFVPYQKNPETVASYYQAADVYVHAARADTFPNTVLEALACGTPVVATAVGGIPEQVKNLKYGAENMGHPTYDREEATGVLVPPGDVKGMASGIERLLSDEVLRRQLGENAARDARRRFDVNHQVEAYLRWYEAIAKRGDREDSTSQSALVERGTYARSNPS